MTKKTGLFLDVLTGDCLKNRFALVIFLLLAGHLCSAQLQRYPVQRTAKTSADRKSGNAIARTKEETPLSLPFWDDFSTPYEGMYPDIVLWHGSFTVWVNDGLALNAPTINVVTFDGLDSAGIAYNQNEILLKGYTDSLVSNKINLGDPELLAEHADSVFLSFFYQWQGNGEAPDPEDHLLVEFRNNTGMWETALTVRPKETFQNDVFYDTIVQVTASKFFHDAFQFRFKSFGRQSGPYDTWNVDYVYLNKGRHINDLTFPDRAAVSRPGRIFGNYWSIPLNHFLQNKQLGIPTFEVFNLNDQIASMTYQATAEIKNYYDDASPSAHSRLLGPFALERLESGDTTGALAGKERKTISTLKMPDVSLFENADSIVFNLKIELNSGDNKFNRQDPLEEDSIGDYDFDQYWPIKFTSNDNVETTYTLSDYYAYDDGNAEYAAGLIQAGNLLAYQFDMPENPEQDTLIAFDIYIPPNGISSNQTVDFFIYTDSAGTPDSDNAFRIPSRPVSSKGVNVFQRVVFLPALLITQEKFYIGWKEPVSGKLLVGLDMSNDTADKIFVNTNGFWEVNDVVHGSLMIRPVFGSGVVDAQVGIEKQKLKFSVYPNPTRGNFYIGGKPDRLEILSITGQPVPFQSESDGDKTFVQLKQPPGLYLLRFTKDHLTKTHKLVVIE